MLFSFENLGYFGQVMYIDNINLHATFTGLSENENEFDFFVYPNPVGSELSLRGTTIGQEKMEVCVFDVLGKEVYRNIFLPPVNEVKIPTDGWINGNYFIRLKMGDKSASRKFVK